jgi:hypothetical protein
VVTNTTLTISTLTNAEGQTTAEVQINTVIQTTETQATTEGQTTTEGHTTTETDTTTSWTNATDCEVLNAWQPDHASRTTCCSQEGITCVEDRITKMYVLLFL